MRLCVVMPVPDHRVAAASRATDALWPAVLAHQGEALRIVEQGCEVDWVHCGHDDRNPSCSPTTVDRLKPSSYPNPPSRASVTPEADKSLESLHRDHSSARNDSRGNAAAMPDHLKPDQRGRRESGNEPQDREVRPRPGEAVPFAQPISAEGGQQDADRE